MIERSRRVVLLIDYDNLQICASRDTPGRDLQLPPVVQLAQRYGTVILARAYAEWNLSTERLAVYKAGIEPAFAPVLRTESDRSGKSLADTVMVAEGMDMLWTLSPDVVVLATSDKDLIPLVRVAKQRGAFVVVLGSDFTAIPLREMADEHVTYKQLITDAQGRYVTEAGPARQPAALPEPVRRRPTRERNGRERTLVSAPVVAPTTAASTPPVGAATPPARVEREPQPSTTSIPNPASVGPAEPVAALTVGTSAEADAQGLGRRRRRRGSRRRSERVGGIGEGGFGAEGGSEADGSFAEGLFAEGSPSEGSFAEGPLAEASFAEEASADGALADDPYAEPPFADGALADDPYAEPSFAAGASADSPFAAGASADGAFAEPSFAEGAPADGPFAERSFSQAPLAGALAVTPFDAGVLAESPFPEDPQAAEPAGGARAPAAPQTTPGAPAPRNRRRSARRPSALVTPAEAAVATPPLASTSQTADILWAAEPAPSGAPAPAATAPESADDEPPADEGAAPRLRSRRTTGPRSRTRPAASR